MINAVPKAALLDANTAPSAHGAKAKGQSPTLGQSPKRELSLSFGHAKLTMPTLTQ